jgi:hypothetical protein
MYYLKLDIRPNVRRSIDKALVHGGTILSLSQGSYPILKRKRTKCPETKGPNTLLQGETLTFVLSYITSLTVYSTPRSFASNSTRSLFQSSTELTPTVIRLAKALVLSLTDDVSFRSQIIYETYVDISGPPDRSLGRHQCHQQATSKLPASYSSQISMDPGCSYG